MHRFSTIIEKLLLVIVHGYFAETQNAFGIKICNRIQAYIALQDLSLFSHLIYPRDSFSHVH